MTPRTMLVSVSPQGEAEHVVSCLSDRGGRLSWLSPCGQWWPQNSYPTMYRLLVGLPRLACPLCHLFHESLIHDLFRRVK